MTRTMLATTALALAFAVSAGAYAAEQSEGGAAPAPNAAAPSDDGAPLDTGVAPGSDDRSGAPGPGEPTSDADIPDPSNLQGTAAQPDTATTTTAPIIEEESDGALLAESVIGMKVMDISGKKIGKVEDIILDAQGQMTGLVISVGGFIGIGAKKVGIRADEANIDLENEVVVAKLEEAALEQAPAFKTKEQLEAELRDAEARQRMEQQQRQQLQEMQQQPQGQQKEPAPSAM